MLVDDDEAFLRATARALRHTFLVATATSATHALEHLREQDIDLAVIDYQLGAGEPDGLALLAQIKERSSVPCAIYSGYAVVPLTVAAMRAGASYVATKDERVLDVIAAMDGRLPPRALRPTLEAMERELVLRTLADCDGNKSRAARVLGISRPALHAMLTRWKCKGDPT